MHRSLISLLARRRRVSIALLLVTLGVALVAQRAVPPHYRATGTVMLATPAHDPTRSSDAAGAFDAALAELQSAEVIEALALDDATLTVTDADRTTVVVSSSAEDPRAAERSVTGAIAWLDRELEERQAAAGVPEQDRVAGRLLTPAVVARPGADGTSSADAVLWMDGVGADEENPYDASPTTARLLMLALSGSEGRETLDQRLAADVTYDVGYDPYGAIASLQIATEGPDAGDVIAAFDEIASLMDLELNARQGRAQVSPARRIFVDVLARPSTVDDTRPPFEPWAIVVVLLGTAAAGAVGGIDARRRGADGTGDAPVDDRPPQVGPPGEDRTPAFVRGHHGHDALRG